MKLLGCTETVTLIRHVQTHDGDSYTAEVMEGVSWFEKAGSVLSASNGEAPRTEVTVRIPAERCPETIPKAGDYLLKGTLPAGTVLTPSVLKGLDAFRVATVGDNRRVGLQHVVVKSG